MTKFAFILAATVAVAACGNVPGQQAQNSASVATSGEARDCVIMGYRVGTSQHSYCVQVMSRRLTPAEFN